MATAIIDAKLGIDYVSISPMPTSLREHMLHRILIIEDDPGVGQLLKVAFEREGVDVLWLTTGTEALAQIESFHPTLVMIDYGLPDMDGTTLANAIERTPLKPMPYRVGMSGGFINPDESRPHPGFDMCLSKPISLTRLRSILSELPVERLSLSEH